MASVESGRMFVLRKPNPEEASRVILNASKNRGVRIICYFNKRDGRVGSATYNPYLDGKGNVMSNIHVLFEAMQDADAVIVKKDRRTRQR